MPDTQYTIGDVMKKLIEHDGRFDSQDKRFDLQDQRFDSQDKRFDLQDQRFDSQDKRSDHLENQIDFLARKAIEHDERFERIEENMVTKAEFRELIQTVDGVMKLLKTKEGETVFITHGMRRHEDRIEALENDAKIMKPLLGLT